MRDRNREDYVKVWPLFNYRTDTKGNLHFQALSLFPFQSKNAERYWGPIWSLVEYKEFENNDRYFALFLRIYSQYWNDREFHLFFLGFEYHNTPSYWSVEFLGGVLGFRRDLSDLGEARNTVRLFWMDL